MAQRERGLWSLSFILRDWSHCEGSMIMSSSKPKHLPKAPPASTVILGVRAQHMNWGEDTTFSPHSTIVFLYVRMLPHLISAVQVPSSWCLRPSYVSPSFLLDGVIEWFRPTLCFPCPGPGISHFWRISGSFLRNGLRNQELGTKYTRCWNVTVSRLFQWAKLRIICL